MIARVAGKGRDFGDADVGKDWYVGINMRE